MEEEQKNFITQEGLENLKVELKYLKSVKRKEIAERIQEAKELGDLSENAEYTEAKNEQAFVEGHIIELEHTIRNFVVIQDSGKLDNVSVGSKLKIKTTDNDIQEYYIVGSKEADPNEGKISNESPMGRAFLGKRVGDVVEVKIPKGTTKFKIIKIS